MDNGMKLEFFKKLKSTVKIWTLKIFNIFYGLSCLCKFIMWSIYFYISAFVSQILLNPRCSLKQQEEKRLRVEVLCEKMREDLQSKEDQYCKEMEEKQKLELHPRNLEMELRTLRKLFKLVY